VRGLSQLPHRYAPLPRAKPAAVGARAECQIDAEPQGSLGPEPEQGAIDQGLRARQTASRPAQASYISGAVLLVDGGLSIQNN